MDPDAIRARAHGMSAPDLAVWLCEVVRAFAGTLEGTAVFHEMVKQSTLTVEQCRQLTELVAKLDGRR